MCAKTYRLIILRVSRLIIILYSVKLCWNRIVWWIFDCAGFFTCTTYASVSLSAIPSLWHRLCTRRIVCDTARWYCRSRLSGSVLSRLCFLRNSRTNWKLSCLPRTFTSSELSAWSFILVYSSMKLHVHGVFRRIQQPIKWNCWKQVVIPTGIV